MTSMWSSPERRTEHCAGSDAARPARPSRAMRVTERRNRADGSGDRRVRTFERAAARTSGRVADRAAATV